MINQQKITERLLSEYERLKKGNEEFMGYPLAKDLSFQELAPFLDLQINNVGDPFTTSSLTVDTKNIEIEVIQFFANLLRAKQENTWGYVTNGGSEGNLYGLYLAREIYPKGIVYYSEETHYSVKKNLHLLNIPNIVIKSDIKGEMDYGDLKSTVLLNRRYPAIFFLNIGTTMKEAIDQVAKIKLIIQELAIKDYYIHCDAAFLGVILPFVPDSPAFDFRSGIDSISISGHKFLGSPIPCGVVLCKKSHSDKIGKSISYVDTMDTTISGSRNGLSPLILWYTLKKLGFDGLQKRVLQCLKVADYAERRLKEEGIQVFRNERALTLVIEKPSKEILNKYQLAVEGNIAHILAVPGITKQHIDHFIHDLLISEMEEDLGQKDELKMNEYLKSF